MSLLDRDAGSVAQPFLARALGTCSACSQDLATGGHGAVRVSGRSVAEDGRALEQVTASIRAREWRDLLANDDSGIDDDNLEIFFVRCCTTGRGEVVVLFYRWFGGAPEVESRALLATGEADVLAALLSDRTWFPADGGPVFAPEERR